MSPSTFKVSYSNVDLLELVVAVRFSKGHFDAIFSNHLLEISVSTMEGSGHVNFQVSWHPNFITKLTKGVSGVNIILGRLREDSRQITIRYNEGPSVPPNGLYFGLNVVHCPFSSEIVGM